jgi:CheY-like chemotaxis protein
LIGNATKFTSHGEIIIYIAVDSESPSDVTLRFKISDTGIGIREDKLKVIFEPFVQAENSTGRKHGGSGLGLSIVKNLVEMMRGQIGVKSIYGKGSIFTFTAVFTKQNDIELKIWKPLPDFTKCKILVISSTPAIRSLLKINLDTIQCCHEEVPDTETAFVKLIGAGRIQQPFDVVIIDMIIPKIHLTELGNLIKRNPALDKVKTIMMVPMNVNYEDTIFDTFELSAYVTKPIKAAKLYQCIIDVLKLQKVEAVF